MEKRLLGGLLAVAGLALLVLSVFAEPLGLGNDGFGWKQSAGSAVGGVVLVVGLALMYVPRRGEVAPGAEE